MTDEENLMGQFPEFEKFMRENDKALRNLFGKYIKGNFLIEMKHSVIQAFPDIYTYYDLTPTMEKVVAGNELMDFDVCRAIVGCHSSNIIFLSDEERAALERSAEYKKGLINNIIQNIKLRGYGSVHFRRWPIMRGELFLAYNLPYDLFVMAIRMNELLRQSKKSVPNFKIYASISNKSAAVLSLLEDNFLDNCYPICRAIIELYLKLVLFTDYPDLVNDYYKFVDYEIRQACCEQKYPDEFNELFDKRMNKVKPTKIDYLHYGWLDKINHYHNVVKKHPYSVNGILEFLTITHAESEKNLFEGLGIFYKMCHGYTHGNITNAKYPLLHYFEVSLMLNATLTHSYILLCNDLRVDTRINGIDIVEKAKKDFHVLNKQYSQRSTELFERHYKN